jgi:NadR type nicotinamide-nucleotide adenylyltransferase
VSSLRRICVTGPESTGKTTLARRLADWSSAEWVAEASRLYAERKASELVASDVSPIAREHVTLAGEAEARAGARGARLVVLDTDLLSTVVYARHYYGAAPRWVERVERERRADLYLLCDVDVPWVPDGVRDRPANRAEMLALFRGALARRHADVVLVRGSWDERWAIATAAVARLDASVTSRPRLERAAGRAWGEAAARAARPAR